MTPPVPKTPTTRIIVCSPDAKHSQWPWPLCWVAAPALAATKTGPVTRFDTDNDGTVDIEEAKKAAAALFDKLDTDKDGTLDFKV